MAKSNFKKRVNDFDEKLLQNAPKVQEPTKKLDLKAAVGGVAAKGKGAAEFLREKTDKAVHAISKATKKKEEIHGMVTVDGALRLMYLVMAADGDIAELELAQLREVGGAFAPDLDQTETIEKCASLVKKLDAENYREELNDAVRDVLQSSLDASGAAIPVKLLLWDLLVIAQSDNRYQEEEARLIRYIARHLEIDKSIVPEMEHSLRAMAAIDNEMAWLKTTDRPFGTVEPIMSDLTERKTAIMQGIHELIND